MSKQACIEELNGDGEVEFIDLRIFAENWLWEKGQVLSQLNNKKGEVMRLCPFSYKLL